MYAASPPRNARFNLSSFVVFISLLFPLLWKSERRDYRKSRLSGEKVGLKSRLRVQGVKNAHSVWCEAGC